MLGKDDIALTASFEIGSFSVSVASNNDECGLISLQKYGNKSSGSYGSRSSYAGEYDYKTALTVTAYSKSDVLFLGWYDEGNALVSTNPVYSFAMPSHDYYLEAKWNLFKIE